MDTVLWLCPSLPTETLKWLSSLPILMQESFWWWHCSDRHIDSETFLVCRTYADAAVSTKRYSPSVGNDIDSLNVKSCRKGPVAITAWIKSLRKPWLWEPRCILRVWPCVKAWWPRNFGGLHAFTLSKWLRVWQYVKAWYSRNFLGFTGFHTPNMAESMTVCKSLMSPTFSRVYMLSHFQNGWECDSM